MFFVAAGARACREQIRLCPPAARMHHVGINAGTRIRRRCRSRRRRRRRPSEQYVGCLCIVLLVQFVLLTAQNAVVDGSAPEVEVQLAAEPTEELRAEVERLVHEHLDECVTATTLMPAGCTFGHDTVNTMLGDVSWEMVEYPDVQLSTERRRLVTAPAEGVAQVSGRYRDIVTAMESDFDEPVSFTFSAAVTIEDGKPAIQPLEAGLSGGAGLGEESDAEQDADEPDGPDDGPADEAPVADGS